MELLKTRLAPFKWRQGESFRILIKELFFANERQFLSASVENKKN